MAYRKEFEVKESIDFLKPLRKKSSNHGIKKNLKQWLHAFIKEEIIASITHNSFFNNMFYEYLEI